MGIVDFYDDSEEIIKPEDTIKDKSRLPEIAIATFKQDLIDEISKDDNWKECGFYEAGSHFPIYKTVHHNQEVVLFRMMMGAPTAIASMEELRARGVKKFIIFGSCGTLSKEIDSSAFILPEAAYRDEGTSYHYLPASEFIEVSTVDKLSEIFEEMNLKHLKTKVWTIDALYKETVNKMKSRKEKGCLAVDMECSAIMAFAKARGVEAYQFLYTDDTLDSVKWDKRTLLDDRTEFLKICLEIALKIADRI